jgi:hypothetical protein
MIFIGEEIRIFESGLIKCGKKSPIFIVALNSKSNIFDFDDENH